MRECESKLYRRIAGGNKERRGQASTVKRSGPSVGAGVGGRHCRRGVVSVLFGEIRAVSGRNRRHGRRGRQRVVSLAGCRVRVVSSGERLGGVGLSRHTVGPAFYLEVERSPARSAGRGCLFPANRPGSAEYS